MQLARINPGDIVKIDKRGRLFYGVVEEKLDRALKVRPITAGISYHEAKSTEVLEHWKKAK